MEIDVLGTTSPDQRIFSSRIPLFELQGVSKKNHTVLFHLFKNQYFNRYEKVRLLILKLKKGDNFGHTVVCY